MLYDKEIVNTQTISPNTIDLTDYYNDYDKSEEIPDNLLLQEKEKELIMKALIKNNGKRKNTAKDLGISERTLYRKLKIYNLEN